MAFQISFTIHLGLHTFLNFINRRSIEILLKVTISRKNAKMHLSILHQRNVTIVYHVPKCMLICKFYDNKIQDA